MTDAGKTPDRDPKSAGQDTQAPRFDIEADALCPIRAGKQLRRRFAGLCLSGLQLAGLARVCRANTPSSRATIPAGRISRALMTPSLRPPQPPNLPGLPRSRSIKITAIVGLAVIYAVGIWALSHRPARPPAPAAKPGPTTVTIPVDVVKTKKVVKALPPPPVTLITPEPVVIPPPRLVVREH